MRSLISVNSLPQGRRRARTWLTAVTAVEASCGKSQLLSADRLLTAFLVCLASIQRWWADLSVAYLIYYALIKICFPLLVALSLATTQLLFLFFFFPFLDMVFHTAFASQHSLQILSRKVQTILPFIESDKPWERNNVKELLVICQVTTRNKEGLQWKMYSYNPSSHRFYIVYFAKDIFAHFDNLQNNKDKV